MSKTHMIPLGGGIYRVVRPLTSEQIKRWIPQTAEANNEKNPQFITIGASNDA